MTVTPELVPWLYAWAAVWGLSWGSFANVVIARLPRGESVVSPASHCTRCGVDIRWYDNIPVLSWFILRGKCRACGARFSFQYALIELLCGGLAVLLWWWVGRDERMLLQPLQVQLVPWLLHFYFFVALIVLSTIDLKHTLLPHRITGPLTALGIGASLLIPRADGWETYFPNPDIVQSLIGALVGFGALFVVFRLYLLATGRIGIGGGDFVLAGAIGAWLGVRALPAVIFAASVQGIAVALIFVVIDRLHDRSPGSGGPLIRGAEKPEFWDEAPREEDGGGSAVAESDYADTVATDGIATPTRLLALPFGPMLALAAVEWFFFGVYFERWMTAGL